MPPPFSLGRAAVLRCSDLPLKYLFQIEHIAIGNALPAVGLHGYGDLGLQLLQPLPILREKLINRFQFFPILIFTAPAGHPVQDVIQPDTILLPEKSPLIAECQTVRLRHPRFGQGRTLGGLQPCQPLRLVRGDANVVDVRVQRKAVQGRGFQLGPPAAGAAAPAVAQVEAVLFGVNWPLQHIV